MLCIWIVFVMNYLDRNNISAVKVAGIQDSLHLSSTQYATAVALLFAGYVLMQIPSNIFLPICGRLESWRWIFIIDGSVTVFIGIFAIFILPNYPSNTSWLSPEERAVDEDNEDWSYGFKMAFKDWRLYVFALIFLCIQVASATSNFFPTVVKTLGYNTVETLLLTVPPYMLGLVVSIANNWSADRFQNSSFHAIGPMVAAIIGFVIAAASVNTGARYFAMILMVAGGHGSNAVIKRASAVAFVNAFGNLAQIFSSYFYPDSSAPRYVIAMAANSAFSLMVIILALCMRIILLRANRRLERGETTVTEEMRGRGQVEIAGVSEEERVARREGFRYIA
ncbi:major facilitator superfamily domain-containing protein [Aspergillus terricola var. indicus]